jgi:hypothetical protein
MGSVQQVCKACHFVEQHRQHSTDVQETDSGLHGYEHWDTFFSICNSLGLCSIHEIAEGAHMLHEGMGEQARCLPVNIKIVGTSSQQMPGEHCLCNPYWQFTEFLKSEP